jgi:crotonobetainyl-CoA:carnitine CoA-transferase CaiB-like acyl-CoA transferase
MTTVIAGPYAAGQLADYGMEVIKVEQADGVGDTYRYAGARIKLASGERFGSSFASFNRGKRSVAVDATKKEGVEIIKKLVKDADVFLQNMRPGVAEKLGLGYEDLKKVNPNLIYCSVSGFGPDGPLTKQPVYDPLIQSRSGFVALQERVSGKHTLINTLVHDKTTAMVAVQAIMAALFARDRNNSGGQHITLAMLDVGIQFLWGEIHSNNHFFVDKEDPRITETSALISEGTCSEKRSNVCVRDGM